ncbi:fatty acid metabolism transcriptional regulator FadR [[Haemophilus] felis]|uniref:Fatty acid metabolism regulator protein n=1 Tax=[Haemophilus] felis TaxID=123822 RepID=A0A1T0B305_9PAST|nr:fatty acid metabolism transcriptional regulator FadR [[Haemophilus] felis]NBI40309.1 fatty acid metabolism transcriptional regulator FadR [[Haemophilus] felis]NBI43678.1 fatty acid metabolism transcriptional regulator FadR [[Haemophilus] felis]OOS04289.1 fatty acid metabolism regulator [[Haemophilus] felis]
MNHDQTLLKAQSPSALAEEYLVKSIWNNHFPPGSDLPAERELADKIGVTRTTLREVLQRLARDGWLNIQHGKPTRVNNIWETSGLNIIEVLIRLDGTKLPSLISSVLSARTDISSIYIKKAFKLEPQQSLQIFDELEHLTDDAESYTQFDYELFRKLAFASGNAVYGLILNSLKSLYSRVGIFYFTNPIARECAKKFYLNLKSLCETQNLEAVKDCIRQYGKDSGVIWHQMQQYLPEDFGE